MFDGVRESFDTAVAPFVRTLQRYVSANLSIHNLGWIVASDEVHEANCQRRPIVLHTPQGPPGPVDPVRAELDRITSELGLGTPPPRRKVVDYLATLDPEAALLGQLEVLRAMHHDTATLQVRDNFGYIARRALHLLHSAPPDRFGQRRLLTPFELFQALYTAAGVATPGPDGDGDEALPL